MSPPRDLGVPQILILFNCGCPTVTIMRVIGQFRHINRVWDRPSYLKGILLLVFHQIDNFAAAAAAASPLAAGIASGVVSQLHYIR